MAERALGIFLLTNHLTDGSTTEAITIPVRIINTKPFRIKRKYTATKNTAILKSVLKLIFKLSELLLSDTLKEYH